MLATKKKKNLILVINKNYITVIILKYNKFDDEIHFQNIVLAGFSFDRIVLAGLIRKDLSSSTGHYMHLTIKNSRSSVRIFLPDLGRIFIAFPLV